eukprot:scaffold11494_cov208-Skeletonema_marinoi.AAC.3
MASLLHQFQSHPSHPSRHNGGTRVTWYICLEDWLRDSSVKPIHYSLILSSSYTDMRYQLTVLQ